MRNRRKKAKPQLGIPAKASRVLNLILVGILLILLRVWHLGIIQHEEKLEESRRPQKKVIVEPSKRGTIRDRFNIPLAINKVQYNVAVQYAQIRQVPRIMWEKKDGVRVRHYRRKEYITELSRILAEQLYMDPLRIEDQIYSKAALFNYLPYIIKEDITEQQYYRLKMLEKDWVGIQVQSVPKRYYPNGSIAGGIIGYMGAISREEYESVAQEIKTLEVVLKLYASGEEPELPKDLHSIEEVEQRLHHLLEHAYSINDSVGKSGIEGRYEEYLRGYHGRKVFSSDAQGNFINELPEGKTPDPGNRILLTISKELQEYAEKLLIQNELIRIPRVSRASESDSKKLSEKPPWIKGGAIVAMDPFSGDVVAMASYPRFDPNDFIPSGDQEQSRKKNSRILKWFETEEYVSEIWDRKRPLEREVYHLDKEKLQTEQKWLDWQGYLDLILAVDSPVKDAINKVGNIRNAVFVQKHLQALLDLTDPSRAYPLINILYADEQHQKYGSRLPAVQQEDLEETVLDHAELTLISRRALDPFVGSMSNNYDKVFLIDLVRLAVDPNRISDPLLKAIGEQSLAEYRNAQAAYITVEEAGKKITRELFSTIHFKRWKELYQKDFLKQKRLEEKTNGVRYSKPYLDLLDRQEEEMFQVFWEQHRYSLLVTFLTGESVYQTAEITPYQLHFINWKKELSLGAHQGLYWSVSYWKLLDSIQGLSPSLAQDYLASMRGFNELDRPLLGRYRNIKKTNGVQLEKNLAAGFYPIYGYGFARSHAFRQVSAQGSIFKVITAYEALIQRYNKLEGRSASYSNLNPLVMVDDTHKRGKALYIGYDSQGRPLPQLYKGGRLPRSHRAGLGKVDLVKALEISSNPYFSLLASDIIEKPEDLARAARDFCFGSRTGIDLPAEASGRVPYDLSCNRNGLYAAAIGQHSLTVTPLQTAVMMSTIANGGSVLKPRIVNLIIGKKGGDQNNIIVPETHVDHTIFLPNAVRNILIEGMYRVVMRTQSTTLGSLSRVYEKYPEAISDYIELKNQLVGKSSTTESMEHLDLDLKLGTNLYNHIWFGGILYDSKDKTFVFKDRFGTPELVVVVYLRYGAWGKDSAPVAAQIAQKWRQIKAKHQ